MREEKKTRDELLRGPGDPRTHARELSAALRTSRGRNGDTQEEQADLAFLYEQAPLGYQCLNEAGEILRVNEEWTRLLGRSCVEVLGTPFTDYLAEGEGEEFRLSFSCLKEEGSIRSVELDMVRKDGSVVTVALDAKMVSDPPTNSRKALCIIHDITARKQIASTIERAKREWEETFDAVPDLVAILDERFRIVRLNKAMAEKLHLDVRKAVGKICYEVVHGSTAPPAFCPHRKLRQDGREHATEFCEPRLGGTFLVTASPIYDDRGLLMGCVHVARDVTERTLAEEALREAHHELEARVRERTAELAQANELLQEKIRTIDHLYEHVVLSGKAKAIAEHTAEVAHELRQPLAIIGGFARRIARRSATQGETDRAAQDDFRHIIREVERLEKVLEGLIDFNRRETIGLEDANPNDLIEHVLRVNVLRVQEKNLSVLLDLDRGIEEILLDPDRFQHVIRNLVANAIEASPPYGAIHIATKISQPTERVRQAGRLDAQAYYVLTIKNSGNVIPQDELEKVFNPFYTTKDSGTGLGLTVSKKIVEEHRGSISVRSDADGTLFTVWLPIDHSKSRDLRPR